MATIGDSMKVTRDDIRNFPGDTIDLILQMQKDGWRAQRSNRSHVMLLAPDGSTKLSASSNANSAKYLGEELRKYNKEHEGDAKENKVKTVAQKYTCPRTNCPKTFNSLEKLDVHINVDHEGKIKCPDCNETFTKPHVLGRHRQVKHGYVSPRYAARKAQEADRAKAEREAERAKAIDDLVKLGFEEDARLLREEDERDSKKAIDDAKKIVDSMPLKHLIPSEDRVSLKEFSKTFDPEEEPEIEHISFIDDRDSWVMDVEGVKDLSIEMIMRNMAAAGLGMEIRVWKEI